MKILITNIVSLNVGDAAILQGMIRTLYAAFGKDIEIIVYDLNGSTVQKYYPEVEFRKLLYYQIFQPVRLLGRLFITKQLLFFINKLRVHAALWCIQKDLIFIAKLFLNSKCISDLVEYSKADLIVSTGGTYLVENYDLSSRIFDYKVSLYFNRPLVFFTQSIGSFSLSSNRVEFKQIFNNASLILLRDKQSLENLYDLGIQNNNIHIVADAAFALADSSTIDARSNTVYADTPLKVAISVRHWNHFKTVDSNVGMEKYIEALQFLTIHLVKEYNAQVTYISTCQGMPEYYTDDSKTALRIFEKLPYTVRGSVVVNTDYHSPTELATILKEFDVAIATRMHMAILALGVGTPVLPIAYEFKMRELFEKLDQGCFVQDIEAVSANSLIQVVDLFIKLLPQIHKPFFKNVRKEIENSLTVKELLITALK